MWCARGEAAGDRIATVEPSRSSAAVDLVQLYGRHVDKAPKALTRTDGETSAMRFFFASRHEKRLPCKGKIASLRSRRDCLKASKTVELPRTRGYRDMRQLMLGRELTERTTLELLGPFLEYLTA